MSLFILEYYQWKQAKVFTIKNKRADSEPPNYRQISLLSICTKIFERAVINQLYDYLIVLGLLCSQQSGVRKNQSTMTALGDVTDHIYDNMDNSLLTEIVFLDLKKAFDTVEPEVLLCKFRCQELRTCMVYQLYDRVPAASKTWRCYL